MILTILLLVASFGVFAQTNSQDKKSKKSDVKIRKPVKIIKKEKLPHTKVKQKKHVRVKNLDIEYRRAKVAPKKLRVRPIEEKK